LADKRFAEVQFFFQLKKMRDDGGTDDVDMTLAMISLFTPPDPAILRDTYGALVACRYQGEESREVIVATDIASVVAMLPLSPRREEAEDPHAADLYSNRFYVVERLGFDSSFIGREQIVRDEEGSDDES
ncbi:hypothetical protein BD309DRAFT_859727, partial [Dichomitus squalens]